MSHPTFRIAYLDRPMYPSFDETLARAPGVALIRIARTQADADILATLATCHGYYVMASRDELPKQWHVTSSLLATLPSLVLVASYGAGYDTIDVDACTRAGVAVVNQAGGNAQGVAEHAIGMMMVLFKRIPEAQRAIIAGAAAQRDALMGRELSAKTVGVIGLGNTGSRTAALARALGCPVLAYDPYLDRGRASRLGVTESSLDQLLRDADFVSLHVPLSAQSMHMIGERELRKMKPDSILINTARGGLVDEVALVRALVEGWIAGAGIDVYESLPMFDQHPQFVPHPFFDLHNVVLTPHSAGSSIEALEQLKLDGARAATAVLSGKPPESWVNPGVICRYPLQGVEAER